MAQENNKEKAGVFTQVKKGMGTWLSMISGKGKPADNQVQTQSQTASSEVVDQEDSIKEDIKKARGFIDKYLGIFRTKTAPTLEKGKQTSARAEAKAKQVFDIRFARRVVRIAVVITFVIFLLFIVIRVRKIINDSQDKKPQGGGVAVSPTVPPYIATDPSIYAQDKTILAIEEDATVLLNEIIGKKLEDKGLLFPQLDLKVRL